MINVRAKINEIEPKKYIQRIDLIIWKDKKD
jgi:hypothetical protein